MLPCVSFLAQPDQPVYLNNRMAPKHTAEPPRPKLLIVEDDDATIALLTRLFTREGWDLEVAETGEKGAEITRAMQVDVVLADKNLPGMSGLELLGEVKRATPDVEVILMTAYASMESVLKAVGTGVCDYLIKPFDTLEVVTHAVERAIERRRMRLENRRLFEELETTNASLKRLNEDLEQTVAERTKQLEQLSLTDDVTGLYNQRFLYRRLDEEHHRAVRYKRPLSILMLDIDYFKNVNDSHDHLFGSRVLRRIGEIIRDTMREVDLNIRYGGDEFVIILPETSTEGAGKAAERLRHEIEDAQVGDVGDPYQVTVSTGVSTLHVSDAESAAALLQAADRAMYAAKKNGRNCVYRMVGDEPRVLR